MVIHCEDVWREVSNYLDGDVDPSLRQAVEEHVKGCKHCTAVLDGTRNVVRLYGDERFVELPAGFSQRLKLKLESQAVGGRPGPGIGWSAWSLAAAAALILAGGLWISRAANPSLPQQSALAKPGIDIPPELLVAVSGSSRVFHVPECGLIHGKKDLKTMKAQEAIRQGLAPCVECLHQYLSRMQRRTRQWKSVDLSGLDRNELEKELPNGEAEELRAPAVRE